LLGSTRAYRRISVPSAANRIVSALPGRSAFIRGAMSQPQRFNSQYEGPFPDLPTAETIAADDQPDRPPSTPVEVGTTPVDTQDSRVPTLILMVGLPAAGKTTRAKELAAAHQALRLTPDHWMIPLFGDSMADGKRFVLEGRLISVALQALRLGTSVVLDYGLWARDERSAFAPVVVCSWVSWSSRQVPFQGGTRRC
jgi:hypothetical protein